MHRVTFRRERYLALLTFSTDVLVTLSGSQSLFSVFSTESNFLRTI